VKKLVFVCLLILTACNSDQKSIPFQAQHDILHGEKDLVDFQSSSAVVEWAPAALTEIDALFDDLLPTIQITGEMSEYDAYTSNNLLGSYEDAVVIVPLDSKQYAINYLIVEINGKYYSATADEEAMKKIRALERKMR
jgi:hypothetical protein